jgi:AcrR family transcriptional regulator
MYAIVGRVKVARVTKHDLRSAATRERLVAVARQLFAEHGYADVGTEQIVRAAGVTRGALYHQFRNKEDLFAAVAESVEADVMQRVAARLDAPAVDSVDRLFAGAHEFMMVCAQPEVQRIIHEAPTVLGALAWRKLSARYGLGLIQDSLQAAIEAGAVIPQPVDPLAHLVMGALDEATRYIATAADPPTARHECLRALRQMFEGLKRPPSAPWSGGSRP